MEALPDAVNISTKVNRPLIWQIQETAMLFRLEKGMAVLAMRLWPYASICCPKRSAASNAS